MMDTVKRKRFLKVKIFTQYLDIQLIGANTQVLFKIGLSCLVSCIISVKLYLLTANV